LFGLGLPLVVQQVYDSIIPKSAQETLAFLICGFLFIIALEALLRIARAHVTGLGAAEFEARALAAACQRFLEAPPDRLAELSDARHLSRLNAATRLSAFYGGQVRWSLIDLPFVMIYLVVMALIGGWLVLAPIGILAAFLVISARAGAELQEAMLARDEQDAKTYDFMTECLVGVSAIKSGAMEPFMTRRLERLLGNALAISRDTLRVGNDAETLSGLLGNVTFVVLAVCGGALAVHGQLSTGSVAACMLLAGRIVQPVLRAASAYNGLQALKLAQDDLQAALSLSDGAPTAPALQASPGDTPRITLYRQGAEEEALEIPFGEIVVLIGPDADGRGELVRTIAGEVLGGRYVALLNDMAPQAYLGSEDRAVALCTRSHEMLRGTVLENLTLFGHGASVAEVLSVSELIGLRAEIERLAAGFDTRLGDSASDHLPSGLLRLIALARVIAMKPKILVLDEPQALLDQHADEKLRAGLSQLRGVMTIILSSSRPSYAQFGDRTIFVNAGALSLAASTPGGRQARAG
jgi:ABC-type bacteriocin/lantibiotic exporter with double-glycine peptidase domain